MLRARSRRRKEQAFDWRFLLAEKRRGAEDAFFRDCEDLSALPESEEAWENALSGETRSPKKREADRAVWTEVSSSR